MAGYVGGEGEDAFSVALRQILDCHQAQVLALRQELDEVRTKCNDQEQSLQRKEDIIQILRNSLAMAKTKLRSQQKTNHKLREYLKRLGEEFELKQRLGKGGFGVVYQAKNKHDGGECALKIIKLPSGKSRKEKVMREVHALKKLDHPRIIRYFQSWSARLRNKEILESFEIKRSTLACGELSSYGLPAAGNSSTIIPSATEDEEGGNEQPCYKFPLCLFMEIQLCREDTLKDWLLSTMKDRPKKMIFDYFEQILEAVRHIHRQGLLHRDLKPSNIFFSREDGGIKVGDFGLVTENISLETSSQMSHSGQVGTWFYMAPEQLSPGPEEKYNQKVDIFALGVIFLEMNYPLTASERLQVHAVLRSTFEPPKTFIKKFPKEAAFVKELLSEEASRRPSAEVVCKELQVLKATVGITSGQLPSSNGLHLSPNEGRQKQEDSGVAGGTQMQHPTSASAESDENERDPPESGIITIGREEELDITESGIASDLQTCSDFPGIQFLSDIPWSASVTSEAQTTPWAEEIGISFDIPEGAVPSGEQLSLSVWPCVSGPFIAPPGYELASPVFYVGPKFKFNNEILLRMAHFVELQSDDDCQRMAFLSAPSTPQFDKQGKPAYYFKKFGRGLFQAGQSDGTVSLSHFCHIAIGKEINAGGPVCYSVQLHQSAKVPRAYFTVSIAHTLYDKNLEAFLQRQHPGVTFESTVKQPVQFKDDEVTLDIPTDSMSGWRVEVDKSPWKITKDEVDFPRHWHNSIHYPPKLQFTLVQPQTTPRNLCRICELSIGGLTESVKFRLKLWKATQLGTAASRQQPTATTARDHTIGPIASNSSANANDDVGSDEVLGQGDLVEITDYLHPIVEKRDIHNLGLVLGLYHDRLRAIEQNSDNFLDDVIAAWLRKEGDVEKRGGPRWSMLVKALQHRRLEQMGIARDIAKAKGLQQ